MSQERGNLEMVMIEVPVRPSALLATVLGIVLGATSFSSHATISKIIPGARLISAALGSKTCPESAGSLRIVEPDDGMGAWASYGLPAPTRMLRVLVNDSRCFAVLDRGVGFAAAQAERALAQAGHLQDDQNIGAGQMLGADFVLIPDIVSQNPNAGGSNVGVQAASGQKRGLMAGMLNVATLGISGRMSSNRQTAQVVLTLVDVRTSEQLVSVTGEAKITDRAWSAMVNASNVQGSAGVRLGSWENTEIGKVIQEAYEEAFEQMVADIQKPRSRVFARQQPKAAPQPPAIMAAVEPLARLDAPAIADQATAMMPVLAAASPPAPVPLPGEVGAVRGVAPEATAVPPVADVAPDAQLALRQLAATGTLELRRTARLLSGASSQAGTVAELATGMLVFPTGNIQGNMLEVEDEMGNKGWVPSAVVSAP
ncbi:CsgG/HfaB family protein [Stenotrophomonas acidaminiphila]|uniref:CsgG/HfaB family protein n=1 Tax=Stenotrophomonas acidaminiphila TaxID=128780 RepID=UPI0020C6DDD1|nr:CsgG/HfaB family protein [Stenotrophomonas acidaminiphila]